MAESFVAAVARRHGLTHAALNALAVIEGAGGPLPTGEIGARMHITTGTTTTVLDTLERKGLVRRLADPDDRRRTLVDVTPEALHVLDRLLPEVQQAAGSVLGAFGDERLQSLIEALAEVRAAIDAAPRDLPPPAARRTPRRARRTEDT